jgi:DNA segregation ATPase FtsK/SpoIIIE-like protein
MTEQDLAEIDPLYNQLKPIIGAWEEISVLRLQREYRLGYNRSARLLEMFAEVGAINWDKVTGKYSAPRQPANRSAE